MRLWVFLGLLVGIGNLTVHAQSYTPDMMTIEEFQKEALAVKEEVWVVDFWASWCGPCIHAIPHMKQLNQKYAERPVRFISISWDKNELQWIHALDQFQMPWEHIRVPASRSAWFDEAFPHKDIPTAFVIDPEGKVKRISNVYKLDKAIYKAL